MAPKSAFPKPGQKFNSLYEFDVALLNACKEHGLHYALTACKTNSCKSSITAQNYHCSWLGLKRALVCSAEVKLVCTDTDEGTWVVTVAEFDEKYHQHPLKDAPKNFDNQDKCKRDLAALGPRPEMSTSSATQASAESSVQPRASDKEETVAARAHEEDLENGAAKPSGEHISRRPPSPELTAGGCASSSSIDTGKHAASPMSLKRVYPPAYALRQGIDKILTEESTSEIRPHVD
ncbi:hypothetical protein ACM66B_005285 [Microbotryomycetes sp. NB124-2]